MATGTNRRYESIYINNHFKHQCSECTKTIVRLYLKKWVNYRLSEEMGFKYKDTQVKINGEKYAMLTLVKFSLKIPALVVLISDGKDLEGKLKG